MTTREQQLEELRKTIDGKYWADYWGATICYHCGAYAHAEHKPDCPIRKAQELLTPRKPDDSHECRNCGVEYKGGKCPRCGTYPREVHYDYGDGRHDDGNVGR